uniref:Protein YIPF n=1 Tax=Cacopsylla melanoneura TaxID=428564 RepID=A0A8D8R2Y2_9HEMI
MNQDKDILVDFEETNSSNLLFQSFPTEQQSHEKQLKPSDNQDQSPNQGLNDVVDGLAKPSNWSIEYFQKFFDVDTDTVISRIKGSIYPKYGDNYFQTYIKSKPDLYGPFWICATLIITIAISGNVANYLQAAASHKYNWKYDFHAISSSATAIFFYAWFVPIIVWGYLKYQNDSEVLNLSMLELLCVYGYSLSIYIPISILWVVQIGFLQSTLVVLGALLSGYILLTSILPAFREPRTLPLIVLGGLHTLLALGLMLKFFHVPAMTGSTPIPTGIPIVPASNITQ